MEQEKVIKEFAMQFNRIEQKMDFIVESIRTIALTMGKEKTNAIMENLMRLEANQWHR